MDRPSFFARLFLSWIAYFRTLFDADFAAGVVKLRSGGLAALTDGDESPDKEKTPENQKEPAPPPKPVVLREATPDAACQLLSVLQREGRFIDFIHEDLSEASDADIGAAARVVHEGCKKAVEAHFEIVPIRSEEEGSTLTVEEGFDAKRLRLTGNVVGEPPFKGTLAHSGWRAEKVELPKMAEGHDAQVLAPAEVEL
ncbi:MAG: DUF2760 domain-containing protein [Myxococcota bacterium]